MEILNYASGWRSIERPGYLGKQREDFYLLWNKMLGEGNWRIANEMANGEVFTYEDIIWKVYVPGYTTHFLKNPSEAKFIADNYSYCYDKDLISKPEAFNPYSLYNKTRIINQFHHVALNFSLEYFLGLKFKGQRPLQIREGKPGTLDIDQPEGFRWSPGRIMAVRPDLTPELVDLLPGQMAWWQRGSIEEQYQLSKVLQVKVK